MNKTLLFVLASIVGLFVSCSDDSEQALYFDGRLETDIVKINAKTSGELDSVLVDEGDVVQKGQLLAVIDSDRLKLQRKQQQAQRQEIDASFNGLDAQLKQLKAQLKLNEDMIHKTENLLDKGAATSQKLDELKTQNDVLTGQRDAVLSQKAALMDKREQVSAAIDLTDLNIHDSHLTAPLNGTVLNRYFNRSELVSPGMSVYDLADLRTMEATIYVSLKRLANINLGQQVEVVVDGLDNNLAGSVKWISSEAEFTPKTILTEETRTSLVYAVKIDVDNSEGHLKIGMPVRVKIEVSK